MTRRLPSSFVLELALDAVAFKKTKHILRAAEFLRDLVLRKVFALKWISGENNPADLFTKVLGLATFREFVRVLDALHAVA